jgi:2-methylisocitrate lyase-like PEP mutase family enzyme
VLAAEGFRPIVDSVHVPVNADLEAGYGVEPEDAAETALLATRCWRAA